jgi:hypothetical protein
VVCSVLCLEKHHGNDGNFADPTIKYYPRKKPSEFFAHVQPQQQTRKRNT